MTTRVCELSACKYVYFVLMYCSCYWVLYQYAIRYARIHEYECVLAVSYKQHIWGYFTPLCDSLGEGEKLVPSLFQNKN